MPYSRDLSLLPLPTPAPAGLLVGPVELYDILWFVFPPSEVPAHYHFVLPAPDFLPVQCFLGSLRGLAAEFVSMRSVPRDYVLVLTPTPIPAGS